MKTTPISKSTKQIILCSALLAGLSLSATAQVKIGDNPNQIVSGARLQVDGNNTTSTAAKLLIDNSGNVGIGTSAPPQRLSVVDGGNGNQFNGIASFLSANLTQGVGIGWSGIQKVGSQANSDLNLNAAGSGNVALITQGTGNVTIGTNLGIGTTTPQAQLHLGQTLGNRKIVMHDGANENEFYGFGVNPFTLRYQVPVTSAAHVFFAGTSSSASAELFRINGNGNATLAGSLTQNSDIRLKKDIVDNTYGLKEILKLRTINYRFKDEARGKDKKVGFIAQEVKAAMPELVSTANDDMKTLSVSYAEMTAVLTKAIQEQQAQIEKLTAALEKTTARNEQLEEQYKELRAEVKTIKTEVASEKYVVK